MQNQKCGIKCEFKLKTLVTNYEEEKICETISYHFDKILPMKKIAVF